MSLKSFHIVFVSICTLLCLFLVGWAFLLSPEPSPVSTALGVVGVAGLLLMPVYGVCFYRKAARIHL
jgi:hypothetical protein